jgi:electron transport complex protein RnfE
MAANRYRELAIDGLWRQNPALVQLLGLCPLLAISDSVVKALGLGLATTVVLVASGLATALIRGAAVAAIRLPLFMLVIATATTIVELLMRAYAFELHQALGIFVPLIASNCIVLARADTFASENGPLPALIDGLMMGLGLLAALLILGALRELIGSGSLFADMDLLFGPVAHDWALRPFDNYRGFLLALLPPGAFLFTGLLIALKNLIDGRRRQPHQTEPIKRARVTGPVS